MFYVLKIIQLSPTKAITGKEILEKLKDYDIYVDIKTWDSYRYQSTIKKFDDEDDYKPVYLDYEETYIGMQYQTLCYIIKNNLI